MTPLDQIERDWSKGNCFYITLEFMKDSEELRSLNKIPRDSSVELIHGLLAADDKCLKHAWIEIDGLVLDHSNNQEINAMAEDYYSENNVRIGRRFTRIESDAILAAFRHADGSWPIGYWGELSDEEVANAVMNYNANAGAFALGVNFSDPLDPINFTNLESTKNKESASN